MYDHLEDNGRAVCAYSSNYNLCGGCGEYDFTSFQGDYAAIVYVVEDGCTIEVNYANPRMIYQFISPLSQTGLLQNNYYETSVYY